MSREKKSKVDDLVILRKILDNSSDPNIKTMISPDENALDSVRRRLAGDTLKTKPQSDSFFHTSDSLEPKVSVHAKIALTPRLITPLPKLDLPKTLPEFELVSPIMPMKPVPSHHELPFTTQELYEVEKIDVILPEFLEVTPKEILQKPLETEVTTKHDETTVHDESLPEWQPIEETQPTDPSASHTKSAIDHVPEFERIDITVTPKKVEKAVRLKPTPIKEETIETPVEFTLVESPEPQPQKLSKKQERDTKKVQKKIQKQAKRLKKLELKKLKIEKRDKNREAKQIVKEQLSIKYTPTEKPASSESVIKIEPPSIKVDLIAFKGVESIDEKTAELLYKNGYFSIENLKDATVDDLVQIRGIKRKLAKQIKKETEQKTAISEEIEFIPIKKKKDAKKPIEEPNDTSEWESYPTKEISKKPSLSPVCTYQEYTLYKRETGKQTGKKTTIHFFSREKPEPGLPAQLPDGYQIAVNKKTGIPYLKKIK
jgi:hypothetical protein